MFWSWVFLVVAIWGAGWTLISFHPPRRPAPFMMMGFFAAWTTTELAPLHIFWQLVGTVWLVLLGALEYWPGWVALAITLASWIGLASSVKGSLGSDRAFTDALRAAIGPNWDTDLDPRLETAGRRVRWSRVLLPFRFRYRGVNKVVKNAQYVEGDKLKQHRLDVYKHRDTKAGAPVLLQIHGGGWVISNKDQQGKPLMCHLAARGWVCVAINYGLSPKATWPDHIVDCKRALAWIREHIAEYGGDPDYVVVTGGSAGGHLSALMGLTANDPQFQPGFESIDTTVRAMIPFYGVFDWTGSVADVDDSGLIDLLQRYVVKQKLADARDVFEAASPMYQVHADAPYALVIHGDLDTLAPVPVARTFVAKLRATSRKPVVYVELRGAHHAFEVYNSIRTMHAIAGVDLFLAWLLSVDPPGGLSPADGGRTRAVPAASPAIDPKPTARTEPTPTQPA